MAKNFIKIRPYINYRDEAGTKNEPDIFLHHLKKGRKIDPHVSNLTGPVTNFWTRTTFHTTRSVDRFHFEECLISRFYFVPNPNNLVSQVLLSARSFCARQRCSTRPGEHDMCCAGLVCICMFGFVLLCVCTCVYPCFALFRTVRLVCDLLSRMGVYPVISWKVGPHRFGALC